MVLIDAEFAALIPPLSDEERQQLEDNLVSDGCREPLVLWNGTLIDGHNRYEICTRRSIKFATTDKRFDTRDEVLLWIIDNQRGRRNLADIDRIALASRRHDIVAAKAKENQVAVLKRGDASPVPAKLPKRESINTRREVAKTADVGERTYDAGRLILKAVEEGKADPKLVDDIRRGKAAIHRVAKDIRETAQRETRKQARVEAVRTVEMDSRIIIGDFRNHADKVADGSLSLIFTDPPYDRQASKMLPELGEFAANKLADGGSLICYVGQTQIPAALDALRLHLRYWWTVCCLHSGGATVMREYGINAGWKAVLWFVKGTRDDNSVFVSDVMSGGREKQSHDWQQAQSEAEYWIEKLCPTDGIVCDPFLGGGTTAAAAKAKGRAWLAFEIDEHNAKVANERIS